MAQAAALVASEDTPIAKLGPVPLLQLDKPFNLDETESQRIIEHILALAHVRHPDFGYASTLRGTVFSPIRDTARADKFILSADHQLHTAEPVLELVKIGPRAIPLLLKYLDDKTPTALMFQSPGYSVMWYDRELEGNPANEREQAIISSMTPLDFREQSKTTQQQYTLTVGDLCFVIIGQIAGRDYQAVRYGSRGSIIINSPSHDPVLVKHIRDIWSNDDPARHLLNSLLTDYATQGIFNGKSLDGWDVASELQVNAAMRLLYYFPAESTVMIADRLSRLDVTGHPNDQDAGMLRTVANGVREKQLIAAVAWCDDPTIRGQLWKIFQQTTDYQLLLAALPSVGQEHDEIVRQRLEWFIDALPVEENGSYGGDEELLSAIAQRIGAAARPTFERYMRTSSIQRLATVCYVLRRTIGDWTIPPLTPLLADTRPIYSSGGPEAPRVCDEAAIAISHQRADLAFEFVDDVQQRDEQIRVMQERLVPQ